MREIEIKLKVENYQIVRDVLVKQGWIPLKKLHQVDFIYVERKLQFDKITSGTPVTRLRVQDKSEYYLNVKVSQTSELDCIEHEVKVDNVIEAKKIVKLLGLNEVMRVSKHREVGSLGDYTVCLDNVDDLGTFIEFEALVSDAEIDLNQLKAKMMNDITELEIGALEEVLVGYDTMLFSEKSVGVLNGYVK